MSKGPMVIIDNGAAWMRVGNSGDNQPLASIPCCVAKARSQGVHAGLDAGRTYFYEEF